jgi:hypothetical protein
LSGLRPTQQCPAFSDAGEHELKGIDGSWRLFSIAAS